MVRLSCLRQGVCFVWFRLPPQRGGCEHNVAFEACSVVSVYDISLNACLSISFYTTKRRMALNRTWTPYDHLRVEDSKHESFQI